MQSHSSNPFHRIEVRICRLMCTQILINLSLIVQRWNDAFFEHATLKDLGLRIQLGHLSGGCCTNPVLVAADDFIVIALNGIHKVGVVYCGCQQALGLTNQLLRARLFPATVMAPKTAATFDALEFFHLLTFESKSSVFEFWNTLRRRTDNTGTTDIPVRHINM